MTPSEQLHTQLDILTERITHLESLHTHDIYENGTKYPKRIQYFTIWDTIFNNVSTSMSPQEKLIYSCIGRTPYVKSLAKLLSKTPSAIHNTLVSLRKKRYIIGYSPVRYKRTTKKSVIPYRLLSEHHMDLNTSVVYIKMLHNSDTNNIFGDMNYLKELLPILSHKQINRCLNILEEKEFISKTSKYFNEIHIVHYNDIL